MIEGFNNQAPTVVCRAVFAVIRKTGAVISVLDRKLGESSKALATIVSVVCASKQGLHLLHLHVKVYAY